MLFAAETLWMVVKQSVIFAVAAVIFNVVISFFVAHFVHAIPTKVQRRWRGAPLVSNGRPG